MASLGNIFIAGSENLGGTYKCGISYLLASKPSFSYIYYDVGGVWQVELSKDSSEVIARTALIVSYDELQVAGFAAIQEALDVLSVKGILSVNLADPARSSVGVYCSNGKSILYVYSLFDFSMGMQSEIKHIDASGNVVESLLQPEPVWNESFRYYRLSQSSGDLFEAYRNLFLAFEALLNSISPKKRSEGERAWLKRCLSVVNIRTSLANSTPTGNEDPVDYIVSSQYENIRCRLQHAKFPNAALPHSHPSPVYVKQAYGELIRIWQQIAGAYFNVPTGGGVITYEGFAFIMGNAFNNGVSIYFTSDDSPPHKEDIEVSPTGSSVYEFSTTHFMGQVMPGVVRTIAHEDISKLSDRYKNPIHRICTKTKTALFGVDYIQSGLVVSGVGEWECIHDIRLINSSQPKIEFTT